MSLTYAEAEFLVGPLTRKLSRAEWKELIQLKMLIIQTYDAKFREIYGGKKVDAWMKILIGLLKKI